MRESNFSNELKKSCEVQGFFYYKIPDAFGMQRFSPPKPFDSFMICNGQVFCIENKLCTNLRSFPLKNIKLHQIKGLLKAQSAGAHSFIFINHRIKSENIIFAIPHSDLISGILTKYSTSIPFSDITDYCYVIERIKNPQGKGKIWDIINFIDDYETTVLPSHFV